MTEASRWPALPGGWRLRPDDGRAALREGAIAVAAVIVWVVLVDALLMRGSLPAPYLAAQAEPLWPRTLWTCLRAVREELVYRLALTTVLAALPLLAVRRVPWWWIGIAILAAQFVNVGTLVLAYPLWGTLRFWLVGATWGVLYRRQGLVTALAAHGLIHLALDPLLRLALA